MAPQWVNRLFGLSGEPRGDQERAATSGLAIPSPFLSDTLGTVPSFSGQNVSVLKALGIAPVWAATSFIAEQIGQLPLIVYKEIDADHGHVVQARSHRSWDMLHNMPNPVTPAGRFWSIVATHILLWGNAFIYKERSPITGMVESLWLLHPSQTVMYWNEATKIKRYQYSPKYMAIAPVMFEESDVIHIMGLSQDGLIGESVIGRVKNAFGTAISRDEFEGGFYQRGAVLMAVVEAPAEMSETAAKNVKDTINTTYGGSSKAFQIGVLEEGAKMHELQMPMRDMEFVQAQNLSRVDIAAMFKLPPNFLGGNSGNSLHYTTVEQNQLHFGLHAVAPLAHVISEALSQDASMMPQRVHFCQFLLDAMFRADLTARNTAYEKAVGKWMTVNEIRALENLPPVPNGDKLDSTQPPPTPPPGPAPPGALPGPTDPHAQLPPHVVNGPRPALPAGPSTPRSNN